MMPASCVSFSTKAATRQFGSPSRTAWEWVRLTEEMRPASCPSAVSTGRLRRTSSQEGITGLGSDLLRGSDQPEQGQEQAADCRFEAGSRVAGQAEYSQRQQGHQAQSDIVRPS